MDRVLTSQAYTVYCRQRCSPSCLQELGWGWVGLVGGQQRTGVCLDLVGPVRRTSTVSLAKALFVSEEPPPSLGPVRRTGRSGLWASPCCLFIYLSDLWTTEEKCLRMFRHSGASLALVLYDKKVTTSKEVLFGASLASPPPVPKTCTWGPVGRHFVARVPSDEFF